MPTRPLREAPILGVVATVAIAVLLVMFGRWRAGLLLLGTALVVAAGLRAVLSERRIGLLAVRGRTFDTVTLAVAGGTLIVLAQSLAQTV